MVGLNDRGFLGGSDRGKPRVDWYDLEKFSESLIAIMGMPTSVRYRNECSASSETGRVRN
jgi:hypothetical protein